MKKKYLIFFLISFLISLTDQCTKYLVERHLELFQVIKVFPSFNLVYYKNIGSAFGMFKNLGNSFFIAVSFFAISILVVLMTRDRENRLGFSLILGGAAGNLMDRLTHGYVIDFLEVYAGNFYWPAFNIADSALTVGISLLIYNTVFVNSETVRD